MTNLPGFISGYWW